MSNDGIEVTQKYALKSPKMENSFPIKETDWLHIKNKISDMAQAVRWATWIANLLFGIVASATIALIFTPAEAKSAIPNFSFLMTVTIVGSLVIGLLCLYIDHLISSKIPESTKKNLLEIMERIEAPYKSEEIGSKLTILKADYYSDNEHVLDITEALKKHINNDQLSVKIDNSLKGDPHQDTKKKFHISYSFRGKHLLLDGAEGDSVQLGKL